MTERWFKRGMRDRWWRRGVTDRVVEERGDREVVQERDERAMVLLEHSVQISLIVLKITFRQITKVVG